VIVYDTGLLVAEVGYLLARSRRCDRDDVLAQLDQP